jgi:glycosidase
MKKILLMILIMTSGVFLFGCDKNEQVKEDPILTQFREAYPRHNNYYQVFVRSFADSDNDGIGDFEGIRQNLSYFKDLGINALWLLPIHPSASYHGYDVIDFYDVNEEYGTMQEFEALVNDAKKMNIDITIDMVLNHTSDQHPWYLSNRDWYTAFSYFGGWMPELDYSKPEVKEEMLKVMKFWIDKGVKGFRVDAAVHIFNSRPYVNGLPASQDMLLSIDYFKFLRAQLRQYDQDVYMVGEVWTTKDYSASFYQGFDSLFNFDVSDRIIDIAKGSNSGYKYINDVNQTYRAFQNVMDAYNNQFVGQNEVFIDAPFLRNHDQDRTASILNETQNQFALELLMGLPGNTYLYYGEELGMKGIKSDGTDGIWDETRRLPFLWGNEFETDWCSKCINYDVNTDDYLTQKNNPNSLFNTYKTLLNLRNSQPALKYGQFEIIETSSSLISAYKRTATLNDYQQEVVVYHNFLTNNFEFSLDGYEVLYYTNGDYSGQMAPRTSLYLVKK